MSTHSRFVWAATALLFALAGCHSSEAPSPSAASTAPPTAASTDTPAEKPRLTACAMVTQAEMSEILGGAVEAKSNDRSSAKTECIYTAVQGVSPYAELTVEWGSGEDAMTGVGMLSRHEPGIADPYEGIGDQAMSVGPALMIRTGEDLMTIVFSGVEEVPARARKVFETAKARM